MSLVASGLLAVTCAASVGGHAGAHSDQPKQSLSRANVTSAGSADGTVKGTIKAPHHLKNVNVIAYERVTAKDGSTGWVVKDHHYVFASGGYGLTLDKKTGAYSFNVKPGSYRLEFNGAYHSGNEWGIVAYGPGKPAAAAFGKSIKVRTGKTTKHINVKAAGDFGTLKRPDPGPSMSPSDPIPGGTESAVHGTWPDGTVWTYAWQLGDMHKYLSFKRTVTVPSTATGKILSLGVYAHAYGKNGAAVEISAAVGS
jgi:hypothetical protein